MEEKVKEIVSVFIKVAPGDIGPATRIDRSAVQSSILLHRMYARLAQEGIAPEDYSVIKVFGDLMAGGRNSGQTQEASGAAAVPATAATTGSVGGSAFFGASTPAGVSSDVEDAGSLGIDIEETAALPRTTDFRKEEFYRMNFTPEEIAYCILQPDPYASFTGLFAVKEAIVKTGNRRRGEPFNKISIGHSAEGKPLYPGFAISISHTPGLAIAVAGRSTVDPVRPALTLPAAPPAGKGGSSSRLAWLALFVAIVALIVALINHA
jgi:phosphopantetheine--protein transferase-like protein